MEELVNQLSRVNIESETAEKIAEDYMNLLWFSKISELLFFLFILSGFGIVVYRILFARRRRH
jgi:hypothetical protein